MTLPEFATKFVLSHHDISSTLLGIDSVEYLQQALNAVNGGYLDNDMFSKAIKLAYPDLNFLDLRKWNKLGWFT